MIWFTSDLHFFHDRILEFHPKRKDIFGSTVEKAKEAMIQLWNSRVNKVVAIVLFGTYIFMDTPIEELNTSRLFILGISSVLVGNTIFKYTELE